MDPNQVPQDQAYWIGYWVGVLVGGLVVGLLCGLLPFFLARSRSRPTLGLVSLICCTVAGLILGLILAVPTSIVFSIAILSVGKPTH